jgi:glycosyltransferase involved in cell wall biosynthesis
MAAVASPTVSVLIVTYQHARYVTQAILSALAQDNVTEVVVVDDASIDGTAEAARSIPDDRVVVRSGDHRGVARLAESYALGLDECSGDLIAVLEGDDLWPPSKMRIQLSAFEDPEVVVSHGPYAVIGASGSTLAERIAVDPEPPEGAYDALPRHLLESYVMPVTAVMRASALREVGFRQLGTTPHWDYPTFLALAARGSFAYTRSVVGIWRKHSASATSLLAGDDLDGADLALQLAQEARLSSRRTNVPSPEALRRSWANAHARQVWQVGRILLLRRRYPDARRLAVRALRRPVSASLRSRLVALVGASILHVDLERWRFPGRRSPLREIA